MTKAAIDRFEGEWAVIVLEDDRRFNFPRKKLPEGCKAGSWLQVEVIDGDIKSLVIDEQETELARQRISDKLAALRRGDHLKKSDG